MENTYYDLILEAEMGDTEAQLVLSLLYEQDGNYTEAAKWCEMAARQGGPRRPEPDGDLLRLRPGRGTG